MGAENGGWFFATHVLLRKRVPLPQVLLQWLQGLQRDHFASAFGTSSMIDERGDKVVAGELISSRDVDILLQVLQVEIVLRVSIEEVSIDVKAFTRVWLLKVEVIFTEGVIFT